MTSGAAMRALPLLALFSTGAAASPINADAHVLAAMTNATGQANVGVGEPTIHAMDASLARAATAEQQVASMEAKVAHLASTTVFTVEAQSSAAAQGINIILVVLGVSLATVGLWKCFSNMIIPPVDGTFTPFENGVPSRKKLAGTQRVGVPGGRSISFKENNMELFSWVGSSFQAAFSSYALLFHLVVWGCLVELLYLTGPHEALYSAVKIDGTITGSLTFITTFVMKTYLGVVLKRFHERFKMCQGANGNFHFVCLVCTAQLPGYKRQAATIIRYALLIMHLNYFGIFGPMDDARWATLRERKLITPPEEDALRNADKKGAVVYVWAVRQMRALKEDGAMNVGTFTQLRGILASMRGNSGKQIAYQNTPVSFAYFHLMCVMIHVFLLIMVWNSALRLHDELCANAEPLSTFPDTAGVVLEVLSTFMLLIFMNTLQIIACWLSNPYGDDATDYDLDFDLVNLWKEAQEALANMDADGTSGDLAAKITSIAKRDEDVLGM